MIECTLPAEVDCTGTKGMEMVSCGTQTLTELTGQGTCDSITFMSFVFLIPVPRFISKKSA